MITRSWILLIGVAGLVLATGCATTAPPAPNAVPAPAQPEPVTPVGDAERISFFVHDARSGHLDAVRKGLDEGIAVDAVDAVDQTALIAAAGKDHLDIVQLLLDRGARPDITDPAGWTALLHATYFGARPELLSLLVQKGANVNAQNDRGATALYLAAASGREPTVRRLLALGADPSLATRSGYTPLRAAQINGLTRIVELLDPSAAASKASAAPRTTASAAR
jgi:ankyrin repeat protein